MRIGPRGEAQPAPEVGQARLELGPREPRIRLRQGRAPQVRHESLDRAVLLELVAAGSAAGDVLLDHLRRRRPSLARADRHELSFDITTYRTCATHPGDSLETPVRSSSPRRTLRRAWKTCARALSAEH